MIKTIRSDRFIRGNERYFNSKRSCTVLQRLKIYSSVLILSICVSAPGKASPNADARYWNEYARDEFDGTYLKRRWFIDNTSVRVDGGRVFLTNINGAT